MLVSAGFDKQVRIWDVQTGALHAGLGSHANWILCLAVSPTGDTIACGDYECKVYLWSLPRATQPAYAYEQQDNQPAQILEGHLAVILDVAFSPNGQLLADGSADHTVRLWDVQSGQLLQILMGHTGWVWSVAFSPDGQTLASVSGDRTIRLWDVGDLVNHSAPGVQLRQTLTGHRGLVRNVAFAPDGEWIVSSATDQTIRIWDRAGHTRQVLNGHTKHVQALAVSPCAVDGRLTLASCDEAHQLRIWDLERGEVIHAWQELGERSTS